MNWLRSGWIVCMCWMLGACGTGQAAAPAAPTVPALVADTVLVPMTFARESMIVSLTTLGGELRLRGGATELVQGVITRTTSVTIPALTAQPGTVGLVQLPPRGATTTDLGGATNHWDLALTNATPLQIGIQAGNQKADLDLGGMQIQSLSINEGASATTINFSQPNTIEMRRLLINTGASKLELLNLLNARFASLVVEGGAGDYSFDFGGKYQRPAQAQIKIASGSVVVRLPVEVGAKILTTGVTPTIAGQLLPEGGGYITQAWRKSEMMLININLGVGSLRVEAR